MAQLDLLTTPPEYHPAPTSVALDPFLPSDNAMSILQHDAAPAKADGAYKTISEVSEELDVPTHVLRFWESRFPQVKPQRMRGRRYYRPADVDVLKKIKTLLYSQGYTIKGAKKHVKDKSHEIHSASLEPVAVKVAASTAKPAPVSAITEAAKAAVLPAAAPMAKSVTAEPATAGKKKLPPELTDLLDELRDLRKKLLAFH